MFPLCPSPWRGRADGSSAGPPGAHAGAACLNRILKSRDYESRARHEARQCRHLSSPRSSRSANICSASTCPPPPAAIGPSWWLRGHSGDQGQLGGMGKDQAHRAPGLWGCSLLWLPDPIIACSCFPPSPQSLFLLPPPSWFCSLWMEGYF